MPYQRTTQDNWNQSLHLVGLPSDVWRKLTKNQMKSPLLSIMPYASWHSYHSTGLHLPFCITDLIYMERARRAIEVHVRQLWAWKVFVFLLKRLFQVSRPADRAPLVGQPWISTRWKPFPNWKLNFSVPTTPLFWSTCVIYVDGSWLELMKAVSPKRVQTLSGADDGSSKFQLLSGGPHDRYWAFPGVEAKKEKEIVDLTVWAWSLVLWNKATSAFYSIKIYGFFSKEPGPTRSDRRKQELLCRKNWFKRLWNLSWWDSLSTFISTLVTKNRAMKSL